MSDNLLTSVIRAWDTDASIDQKQKVILVAPAMNSVASRSQTRKHHSTPTDSQTGHVEEPHHGEATACAIRRLGLVPSYCREPTPSGEFLFDKPSLTPLSQPISKYVRLRLPSPSTA